MADILRGSGPPIVADHVAKIAVGPKKLSEFRDDINFTVWETLLSEIIVGDAFGVDRIDYLLRDAYTLAWSTGASIITVYSKRCEFSLGVIKKQVLPSLGSELKPEFWRLPKRSLSRRTSFI